MKESITIMGAVCKPDYGAEGHNWFLGELSRIYLDEILRMSEVCKSKRFNTVTQYSSALVISKGIPKSASEVDIFKGDGYDPDLITEDLDELIPDDEFDNTFGDPDVNADIDDGIPYVEGLELHVSTTDIWWSWFPGHSDANCETELITIEELKEAFKS